MENDIAEKLEGLRREIILQVKTEIIEPVIKNQKNLSEEIGNLVTQAIKDNQHTVVFKLDEKQPSVKKRSETIREWLGLIIPAFTTIGAVILGFIVWKQQTNIAQDLSSQEKNFAIQLSLKQKYTDKRFDTYKRIDELLYLLYKSAEKINANSQKQIKKNGLFDKNKKKLADDFSLLLGTYESQKIYASDTVAIEIPKVSLKVVDEDAEGIKSQAENIRKVIREEMNNELAIKKQPVNNCVIY